jgi:iron complex outermembrane receptor protein
MIRASDLGLKWTARAATVLAILLAGATARLAAQSGAIRGRVVRADRPVGVADVDLELRSLGAKTRSDAHGYFEFRGLVPGQVELAVRRLGFVPAVVVLQVSALAVTAVDIRLEPVSTLLDPIVTSATRDARSVSEVPAAVSVADSSAIRRDRTVGLHETLRLMPGVQVASRYGGMEDVKIGIRGSASRAGQTVRGVAVLLDGIPLTESDGAARLDIIELAASRQVEVVRGPVTALHAGSPNGVVNVVSRTGRDSRGISVRALRGAFGFQKYDGYSGAVFANGRGSGFAAGSYTSADGYRAHSDGDVLRGQVAFDYVVRPSTRVAMQANVSRLDLRLPGSQSQPQFDADPDGAAPIALTLGLGRGDNRWRAGARIEQTLSNGNANGYFFYGGRTLDFPTMMRIIDLNLHRAQGGMRVRADRVARSPFDATIGFDYDNIFGADHRWLNVRGVRGSLDDDGYLSVPNRGVYSQLEWRSARSTGVTLGLRYDRVTYGFESYMGPGISKQKKAFDQLSPRLSAVLSPDSVTSLYASVGRGLEVPAIGEISQSPGAALSYTLRPKSLWNYEVGVRRTVGDRARVDGSIFYADVRGEFVPRSVNGVNQPENASRSRNIGVELGATARVTRQVELLASYTFLDLRLQDYTSASLDSTGTFREVDFRDKLLPAVPRQRLTSETRISPLPALDLGVQLEWQGLTYVESSNAEAGVWYFRSQAGAPVQQVPFRAVSARTLLHMNAAWRWGAATLFGSVENVFGLRYVGNVMANESTGRFYESGSPASVSLGVSLTGWGPSGSK